MKLLILCQKVNRNDPILGFFDRWIDVFSKEFEKTTVICLEKGESDLPQSVHVSSLGKEKNISKFFYLKNFFQYIWNERKNYDAVFVHMNQEYVILGWVLWKIFGKKVYLWRNHHYGNVITWLACVLSDKIFCTSTFSYTYRFKKCVIMPTGIDLERFYPRPIERKPHSVLFIARISPVKKPDFLIRALAEITDIPWTLTVIGTTLPADTPYRDSLITLVQNLGLNTRVTFRSGVPYRDLPEIFSAHEICVNLSPSGMYDKTIFEAMACGTISLATNPNLNGEIADVCIAKENNMQSLVESLRVLLCTDNREVLQKEQMEYVFKKHSLTSLSKKVVKEMTRNGE